MFEKKMGILEPMTGRIKFGSFSDPLGPRVYGGQPVYLEYNSYFNNHTVRLADRSVIGSAYKDPFSKDLQLKKW